MGASGAPYLRGTASCWPAALRVMLKAEFLCKNRSNSCLGIRQLEHLGLNEAKSDPARQIHTPQVFARQWFT